MRVVRAALLPLAVLAPSLALAAPCAGFTDVDDANPAHAPFCTSVEWMKLRSSTLGVTIASGNLHGVALAAIQGLNAKLDAERAAKDPEIAILRAELHELRSLIARPAPR